MSIFKHQFPVILLTALAIRQAIALPNPGIYGGASAQYSPPKQYGAFNLAPIPNVTIYDFGLGIWPENLNVSPNGQILTTLINRPEVWQINPFSQQDGVLVHRFEGYGSTLGIVETFPDIFHMLVGNFTTSPKFDGVTGTYSVWELDFTAQNVAVNSLAKVSHLVDIPQAEILDGMEVLNPESGLVLVADTKTGVLYTVDVRKKAVLTSIDNELFDSKPDFYIGIDGIKLRSNATHTFVYYTNAARGFFGRVQLDPSNGQALGPVERLPVQFDTSGAILDDFIFDNAGNAYLTNAGDNQGIYVAAAPVFDATNATFITSITGPTACRFGRTEADANALYITSTGGDFSYPSMNLTITSKLSRIILDRQSGLA